MVTVRPATLADLIWIRQLYGMLQHERPLVYPDFREPESLEAFTASVAARLGREDPSFFCSVAEEGDVVGGFVLGEVMRRAIGSPHLYGMVHWMYVIPAWRGRGIGRELTAAGVQFSAERGLASVEICAAPGDPQWQDRGWIPVAVTLALPLAGVAASLAPRTQEANGGTHPAPVES